MRSNAFQPLKSKALAQGPERHLRLAFGNTRLELYQRLATWAKKQREQRAYTHFLRSTPVNQSHFCDLQHIKSVRMRSPKISTKGNNRIPVSFVKIAMVEARFLLYSHCFANSQVCSDFGNLATFILRSFLGCNELRSFLQLRARYGFHN